MLYVNVKGFNVPYTHYSLHCVHFDIIIYFTFQFTMLIMYKKASFLCKYLYTDNTYGWNTIATALRKEICE